MGPRDRLPALISERLAVGGQPTEDELKGLAESGISTVVNLRQIGETSQPMDPEAERRAAEALGLTYHHLPVSIADLTVEEVRALRSLLDRAEGPVYVHCGAGQRACALSLAATGVTGKELLDEAERRGYPVVDDTLARFIMQLPPDTKEGGP
ncbi:MAG: sulfur transferase domain-containing protein [Rhodospirillales bacterium]|nr:sulfur transferase domain-containing protein [Rhodospirillales bacterium]